MIPLCFRKVTSQLWCLIYHSRRQCNNLVFNSGTQKPQNHHHPSNIPPPLYCAEDNACTLSLTPCISNYSAAPGRSALTIPTCYTAECLASKWDGQEISHWSHLDNLMYSTGGNNHPSTVGYRKVFFIYHIHIFNIAFKPVWGSASPLWWALFENSIYELTLVCFLVAVTVTIMSKINVCDSSCG